jgi:MinD superfamily P-loop ATPase
MKEVLVLSGKGGTGKTSILGSFAAIARNKVLADCDVDAADLHLLLDPKTREEEEFMGGEVAVIDEKKCTGCGLCEKLCRFEAIARSNPEAGETEAGEPFFRVDPVACEGCGFCARVCLAEAIAMREQRAGTSFVSETRFGPLVHARLGVAREHSGKLVARVRRRAREIAERETRDLILIDGPPGIGCPVISSVSGVNLVLLVTEPTLSGIHDLERVLGVLEHFGVRGVVCVNKCDINEENTYMIEKFCLERRVSVLGRIPYDDAFTDAMVRGKPLVEHSRGKAALAVEALWNDLSRSLG